MVCRINEGCVIEEATGCIEDLRHNKSGNVYPSCKIAALRTSYDTSSCCPKFGPQIDSGGKEVKPFRLDLAILGSSFPAAFKCLERAGCSSSLIYQQLDTECNRACGSISDPRPSMKKPICHAEFNSAIRGSPNVLLSLVLTIVIAVIISAI